MSVGVGIVAEADVPPHDTVELAPASPLTMAYALGIVTAYWTTSPAAGALVIVRIGGALPGTLAVFGSNGAQPDTHALPLVAQRTFGNIVAENRSSEPVHVAVVYDEVPQLGRAM